MCIYWKKKQKQWSNVGKITSCLWLTGTRALGSLCEICGKNLKRSREIFAIDHEKERFKRRDKYSEK